MHRFNFYFNCIKFELCSHMAPSQKKKAPGRRNYKTGYSEEQLKTAIHAVNGRNFSIRKASKFYKIPFGTLRHKIKNLHSKNVGCPKRLCPDTEASLVKVIDTLAEWKVPLTGEDISLLVKGYLDFQGVKDSVFKDNLPGKDWLKNFVETHGLTRRIADNVRIRRAEISPDIMNDYFDNLEQNIIGIPPERCFNYDETNVTDNPGCKKVIVRRGLRRVERKVEHTKQSTSVMFCGSASGLFLPPMVVYKAQNCYSNWEVGGPKGSIYDATTSGWFDSRTFERWFSQIFLPHAITLPGEKLLIGDNLASHFSDAVISECLKHNIVFVTMPAASTHLCQPLDVAVFGPAKRAWRNILDKWRYLSYVEISLLRSFLTFFCIVYV